MSNDNDSKGKSPSSVSGQSSGNGQNSSLESLHLKPKFDDFLVGDEDYDVFRERVELFMDCNCVPVARQPILFLNCISQCVYKLIKDRVAPVKPSSKSMVELYEILDKHYVVKRNKRAERYKFSKVIQQANESLADFLARIREVGSKCEFGDFVAKYKLSDKLTSAIRAEIQDDRELDRFVMGIHNDTIQQELLLVDPESLEAAYEKAKLMQMAMDEKRANKEINSIGGRQGRQQQQQNNNHHQHQQKQYRNQQQQRRGRSNSKQRGSNRRDQRSHRSSSNRRGNEQCGRCGRARHDLADCPAREIVCHTCNRKGHFARWCRDEKVEVIAAVHEDTSPVKIDLVINNHKCRFLVDSGACSNLLSPNFVASYLPLVPLKSNTNSIRTFSGQQLNVAGRVSLPVSFVGRTVEVQFLVVDIGKDYEPLIGRPGLDALFGGWRNLFKNQEEEVCVLESSEVAKELKFKYPNVFDGNLSESIKGYKAEIVLSEDHKKIVAQPYNIPFGLRDQVEKELQRLQDANIIIPCQATRYASPIVVVAKAGGNSIRICIDCKRTINKYVVNSNFYPLPHQDMIFAAMNGANIYCKIDLTNAYLQLQLEEESKEYLTITTPFGYFRYQKLPFGVCAAPSIFQSVIDRIINGIPMSKTFIDDILIGGKDEEDCRKNLHLVLERLQEHNVKVNTEKCVFLQKSVAYLGHILSAGQVQVNPEKLEALHKAPTPKNAKEVKAYVGLLNYFRSFIPSLAEEVRPLYALLKKDVKFQWTVECDEAFNRSKLLITKDAYLKIFDPAKPTLLLCDASPVGVSAVLMQRGEDGRELPVHYASMALTKTQQNYAQLHREGLAIIYGLKKFYQYLYGRRFTIVTDAQSIKEMFSPEKATPAVAAARIQRWGVYLTQFIFDIIHRSSNKMCVPDALSRLPLECNDMDLEDVSLDINCIFNDDFPILFKDIVKAQEEDSELKLVKKYLLVGFPKSVSTEMAKYKKLLSSLSLEENGVFFNDRIIIPKKWRNKVLDFCHKSHNGIVLMKKLARSLVYWPGLDKDIEDWIHGCEVCQELSTVSKKKVSTKWTPSTYAMERIHIDFFFFEGQNCFLIMDTFTKYIEVILMKQSNAEKVIEVLKHFFDSMGWPGSIVSDNGSPFASYKFEEFCKRHDIKLIHSPAYNPESNGQAEVGVRIIKTALKKVTRGENRSRCLADRLKRVLVDYRNSPRAAGSRTPMEMLLSYKPRRVVDLMNVKKKVVRFDVKEKDISSVKRNNVYRENLKNKYHEFRNGDKAYYLNHRQSTEKWIPCKIIRKDSTYIYKIKCINEDYRLSHVSKLRPRKDYNEPVFPDNNWKDNFDSRDKTIKRKRSSSDENQTPRRSKRLNSLPRRNYKE